MDPISKTDRLIALLRQRLKEKSRTAGGSTRGEASRQKPEAVSGLSALTALHGLDQGQLRRACIQALLADQFGPELINEPHFQQVVTRVTDALAADVGSAALLDQVMSEFQGER
jgi:hypothetical protein